ncbi:MAG TPA: beta-ketoacyl reductase, partial [Labilithrix sp.]|nr:beta-ketoacyl reductase [Labilithrix sp.]
VLDDATLSTLTAARVGPVLAPKVLGALALDSLLPDLAMRVYFSSVTGVLGSAGQAHYAAANASRNAFAHSMASRSEHALSLDWGAWGEVGLVARADRLDNVTRQGLAMLSPEEGADLFERTLSTPAVQVAPMPIDFRQWRQANPRVAGIPFLREVIAASAQRPRQKNTALMDRLRTATSESERINVIEEYLRVAIANVLRASPESVTRSAPLKQMGFDSLMTVSLKNTLERDLAIPISTATLFAYPSVEKLAAHVAAKLVASSAETASRQEPPVREALPPIQVVELTESTDDIESLSDAEVAAQLADTLRRLQVVGGNDG